MVAQDGAWVLAQRGFREPRGAAQTLRGVQRSPTLWGVQRRKEHLQLQARVWNWRAAGDTGREAGWKAAAALRGDMEEDMAAETAWDVAAMQRELEEHEDTSMEEEEEEEEETALDVD
eukprot:COSAG01_NODE_26637_length_707_cov_3.537829_1_plen_118_part_00